jgi:hypothetical protein
MRAYGTDYDEKATLPIPATEAIWGEIAKDADFYQFFTEMILGKYVPFVPPNKSETPVSKEIRRHNGIISIINIFAGFSEEKEDGVSPNHNSNGLLDAYVEDKGPRIPIFVHIEDTKIAMSVNRSDTVSQVIQKIVKGEGLLSPKKHFLFFPVESR